MEAPTDDLIEKALEAIEEAASYVEAVEGRLARGSGSSRKYKDVVEAGDSLSSAWAMLDHALARP